LRHLLFLWCILLLDSVLAVFKVTENRLLAKLLYFHLVAWLNGRSELQPSSSHVESLGYCQKRRINWEHLLCQTLLYNTLKLLRAVEPTVSCKANTLCVVGCRFLNALFQKSALANIVALSFVCIEAHFEPLSIPPV
jgi:hypothetical protein